MDPGISSTCIHFLRGWIMKDDRMDPGFSSICFSFLGGDYRGQQDGPWIFLYWLYIQFVVCALWRRTEWTLDFPQYILSLRSSRNSLPLLFACFLKENPFYLKGQCHEIFDFRLFLRISFPQAPENTIRAVSNLFENSQRYSQLKLHHRVSLTLVANEKNLLS